jgi:hypothetical protein
MDSLMNVLALCHERSAAAAATAQPSATGAAGPSAPPAGSGVAGGETCLSLTRDLLREIAARATAREVMLTLSTRLHGLQSSPILARLPPIGSSAAQAAAEHLDAHVESWRALPDVLSLVSAVLTRTAMGAATPATPKQRTGLIGSALPVLSRLLAVCQLTIAPLPDPHAAPPPAAKGPGGVAAPPLPPPPPSPAFLTLYRHALDAITATVRPLVRDRPPASASVSASASVPGVPTASSEEGHVLTVLFDLLKHRMLLQPHATATVAAAAAAAANGGADDAKAGDGKAPAGLQRGPGGRPIAGPPPSAAALSAVYYNAEAGMCTHECTRRLLSFTLGLPPLPSRLCRF